ncbi:hypothetical protein AB1Y20_002477 [Prymnesium parvum]|uniref:Ankyrin repeat domain-containing protein n=1 Tax=Prymnesium parvum TaxID=97485 RepID=A0AB34J965_PRYPA
MQNTTALWCACLEGGANAASEVARLVYDEKVDVNELDSVGRPALWVPCRYGDPQVAKVLLDNGAKVDFTFKAKGGNLLLQSAGDSPGHVDVARMLLERGADVNQGDVFGMTPLMTACLARNERMVKLFLSYGADKTSGFKGSDLVPKGSTAADFARLCNEEGLARLVDPN